MHVGQEVRQANRLRVLEAIRRSEPVSRIELARVTGLGAATISEITGELLSRAMLLEAPEPAAGRGRPRVRLRLNPHAAHVVGAFALLDGSVAVEIADLRGEKLFERSVHVASSPRREMLASALAAAIDNAIAAGPVPKSKIHSVGLGLPGMIDRAAGVLHWLPPDDPDPFPLAEGIQARLGLPVVIDNTANVMARAEHWFGDSREVDDFTLVIIGPGLGMAQYVGGELWSGSRSVNSEFGHVKVTLDGGPRCICGAQGCLATFSSTFGLVARACEAAGRAAPPLQEMFSAFHGVVEGARNGEAAALAAFELAGLALGRAIANHINVWNPTKVIVLAQEAALLELIQPAFLAALDADTLPPLRGRTEIRFRTQGDLACSQGAAALVLEQLYRAPRTHTEASPA
jgi:predicted NBD/HSP70 family sugar kinase